ncbi:MAG: hypothetical protein HYT37_03140 [Candidatus Sungbacteria bacterium]|nr:hypothetical protein [Candidatus Sungbacteria bacterium]
MIFVFHGKDTYHSRRALNAHIREYQNNNGSALNMHRIDCEEEGVGDIKNLCGAESLFSAKKLIIAENFLHNGAEFENILPSVSAIAETSDTTLFLWERAIGKDLKKKFSKLFAAAKVEEFEEYTVAEKQKFIESEAEKRGIVLSREERERLFLCRDAWGIINTLDMLMLGRDQENGKGAALPLQIFALGDTFHSASPGRALSTLFDLIRQGEDDFGVFGYISGHTRTLLIVKAFAEMREPLPASFGIHPFVIKKTAAIARNVPISEVIRSYTSFFEEDVRIKTGLTNPQHALASMLCSRALRGLLPNSL